jgi:ribosomal protein L40E
MLTGERYAPCARSSAILTRAREGGVHVRTRKNMIRLIEPNGRPHIECPKCGVCVVWPTDLSADQAELAAIDRSDRVQGARYAHERLGLGLREAKALSLHITRTKGACHRCGTKISGRIEICRKCNSANLDW